MPHQGSEENDVWARVRNLESRLLDPDTSVVDRLAIESELLSIENEEAQSRFGRLARPITRETYQSLENERPRREENVSQVNVSQVELRILARMNAVLTKTILLACEVMDEDHNEE